MDSINSTAFWWPHPDSFSELTVEDSENGFELSAPDDSEIAQWLSYYNSSDELRAEFNIEFMNAIQKRIDEYDSQEKMNG